VISLGIGERLEGDYETSAVKLYGWEDGEPTFVQTISNVELVRFQITQEFDVPQDDVAKYAIPVQAYSVLLSFAL